MQVTINKNTYTTTIWAVAVLDVLTAGRILGWTFHTFILKCSNNLKRLFELLRAIIGESRFMFMLTLESCYKQLKHDKTYLIMSIYRKWGYRKLKLWWRWLMVKKTPPRTEQIFISNVYIVHSFQHWHIQHYNKPVSWLIICKKSIVRAGL